MIIHEALCFFSNTGRVGRSMLRSKLIAWWKPPIIRLPFITRTRSLSLEVSENLITW